ncbi:hypothetical protein SASPL_114973 [Salvia splendens]|uniref:PI4-kinase N-terminal domain-containing protein n=1 Tax=Salvia splendens TaxID=180675 RepID=A0A8X8Y2Y0_SALSN|nr:hypothetical protein SASPL_114973 [Salvia splendens]
MTCKIKRIGGDGIRPLIIRDETEDGGADVGMTESWPVVKWVEDELELNALHHPGSRRGSGNETAAGTQRSALAAALGGRVEVSAMSTISVAFLEIIRFSSNGGPNSTASRSAFSCAFEYLRSPNLMPAVSQYLHKFDIFLSKMSWSNCNLLQEDRASVTGPEAEIRESTLSVHDLSQRDEHVRDISFTLLTQLRDRLPQILWNSSCLDALLLSMHNDPPSALVSDPAYENICKANTRQRTQPAADVVSLLSEIRIGTGKKDCWNGPKTANIPAVMAAAAAASGGNLKLMDGFNLEVLGTGYNESIDQSTGALNLDNPDGSAQPPQPKKESFNEDSDSKSNPESFSQLLRLLCWCPAYLTTLDAVETGVFIWTWLVSAAPQLGSVVLAELVDAWLWTIDTKRGLFASDIRCYGPSAKLRPQLFAGEPQLRPEKDPVEQIMAHRLWLGFFF